MIDNVEIAWVLAYHKKLLDGEPDGVIADLRDADLHGIDLSGESLNFADLRGADLRGANLSRACLYQADLSWADLRGAYLVGAILYSANLYMVKWTGAIVDENNWRLLMAEEW